MTADDLIVALPEVVLACGTMLLMMLGVFLRGDTTRLISLLSVVLLAVVAAIVALGGGEGRAEAFNGLFVADGYARFVKVLILGASAVVLVMALDYVRREDMSRFELALLVLFATLGMLMMVSANDLMALYLGLEMQSLALYVLAAFRRDNARSTEAGLKYFLLGALSSGMLLYGMSLVYGFAGTTSFDVLRTVLTGTTPATGQIGVVIGLVFLAAGLAFKVSAVPFHMWTPDVYEGAPTPITAFFAAAPKLAAIALFVRVMMHPFGDLSAQWQQILWFISVASMILGALAAINQRNIKRLMAYSSIGNVGYALVGLTAASEAGVRGVLIYMAIYVVMTLGSFACILSMRVNDRMLEDISDLAGLSRTRPMMALALAVFMFSMAGIPPLAGFFGKFYVFMAAIEADLIALAIIGVVTSVLSAYYYLRIVKVMYFDDPGDAFDREGLTGVSAVMAVSGTAIAVFLLFASTLVGAAGEAAKALLLSGG